jgi:hypothetical protein
LLKPTMKWCRPPWALRSVSGSSRQGWDFRFYNPNLRETVRGYLFSNGNAGFKSLGHGPEPISDEEMDRRLAVWRTDPSCAELVRQVEADRLAPPLPTALPDQWLDSNEVLAIAETVQPPEELDEISSDRYVSLDCGQDPVARWRILVRSTDSINRVSWSIELDAQKGDLLREVLSRPGEGSKSWIIFPWRERIPGGPWRDL